MLHATEEKGPPTMYTSAPMSKLPNLFVDFDRQTNGQTVTYGSLTSAIICGDVNVMKGMNAEACFRVATASKYKNYIPPFLTSCPIGSLTH